METRELELTNGPCAKSMSTSKSVAWEAFNTSFFRNDALSNFNIDYSRATTHLQSTLSPLFHLVYGNGSTGNVEGLLFPCSKKKLQFTRINEEAVHEIPSSP